MEAIEELKTLRLSQEQGISEVHQCVKHFFLRNNFDTYGDAFNFLINSDSDERKKEAKELDVSEFSRDILWLVGTYGSETQIEKEFLKIEPKFLPKKEKPETSESKEVSINPKKTKRKQKRRFWKNKNGYDC